MTIDPRLAERRKTVAEDHAKRNVSRLLRVLFGAAVLAALTWLAFSPWFSVSQVRTAGIQTSDANLILVEQNVVAGRPMVLIRSGVVETALESDPWIAEARVHLDWPRQVIVRVVERTPVAWVETAGGWTRRAIDGVAVPSALQPDRTLPWVHLPGLDDADATGASLVLGAVEFSAHLFEEFRSGTIVTVEEGDLWAMASGYRVRLGRPVEMKAKALSLGALLQESIPEGSTLILIAPTHPAISPPDSSQMPEDTDSGSDAGQDQGSETGDDQTQQP